MRVQTGSWSNTALWVGSWLICIGLISVGYEVWAGHKFIGWWTFVTTAAGILIFTAGFLREWVRAVLRAFGLTRRDR